MVQGLWWKEKKLGVESLTSLLFTHSFEEKRLFYPKFIYASYYYHIILVFLQPFLT